MSWAIERVATVTSTMDVARERARSGAPDGTVIVAQSMTGGRGTHGRAWHAPPGGLYLSLVIRGLQDPHLLTLALGNAVADVLEVAGAQPHIKWVNDVMVNDRKIAGILVEGEATGGRFDFLVAGIGVNVNGHAADFPLPIAHEVTTLEDVLHCDSCIPDIETYLLEHVAQWLRKVRDGAASEIVDRFRERDALLGRRITVHDGHVSTVGTAQGVDARGHLLLRTDAGVRAFATGTVRNA